MARAFGVLVSLLLLAVLLVAAIVFIWRSEPTGNTAQTHFDTILVLGTPSNPDGSPAPEQRERVEQGIRLWRAGEASHIILSGGAAHNRWVEAHTMGELARREGVPAADVLEEGRSQNTIQNVFYTLEIMRAHGWHSALVVTSWYHTPRAGRILSRFPLQWRTVVAPWPPEESLPTRAWHNWKEALYDVRLRLFGFPPSPFLPGKS